MPRLFWIILALIVLAVAAFASMLSFGPVSRSVTRSVPPGGQRVAAGLLAVPVQGIPRGAITDTWGQARGEGRVHHGTDIIAAAGTPVTAAAPGTIEKLFQSRLGGTTIYERSPARRWTYYYAHLAGYAAGLHEGQAVRAGETIGFVGDTGDAGAGNYHLHFGLTRTAPDQHWYQGQDVNAYPLLAGRGLPR